VGNIPHPIVARQISMPQPKLAMLVACLVVPACFTPLLSHGLMHWRSFWALTANHNTAYWVTCLLVSSILTFGAVVILSQRYASAIWTPRPAGWRRFLVFLIILLPLLLFHLSHCLAEIQDISTSLAFPGRAEANQMLVSIYHNEWDYVTSFDTSAVGVVCDSIKTLVVPVLEEVVFTGFLVNAIAKLYGFAAAVVGTSACFVFFHVFKFAIDPRLIPLFFAAATYGMIRICTGSILLAVLGHCTINAVIYLPKWVIAAICFTRL
jgi:membrane protease YdiL (CAAX protease family)